MPSPQRLSKALIPHPSPSKPGGCRARSLRPGAARSQQVFAGEAELSGAPPLPPCGTRCAGAPTATYLAPCLRMAAGSAPPFSCRQGDAPHRLGGGSEYLRSSPPTPPLQKRAGRKRGITALVSLPPSLSPPSPPVPGFPPLSRRFSPCLSAPGGRRAVGKVALLGDGAARPAGLGRGAAEQPGPQLSPAAVRQREEEEEEEGDVSSACSPARVRSIFRRKPQLEKGEKGQGHHLPLLLSRIWSLRLRTPQFCVLSINHHAREFSSDGKK